jgi:hypothetical protein
MASIASGRIGMPLSSMTPSMALASARQIRTAAQRFARCVPPAHTRQRDVAQRGVFGHPGHRGSVHRMTTQHGARPGCHWQHHVARQGHRHEADIRVAAHNPGLGRADGPGQKTQLGVVAAGKLIEPTARATLPACPEIPGFTAQRRQTPGLSPTNSEYSICSPRWCGYCCTAH